MKFDRVYPFGEKQDAFKALAEESAAHSEIVIADVSVAGLFVNFDVVQCTL